MAMSNDMEPGPASMGMASGVKAISFLFWASLSTSLFTPLVLLNFLLSNANPEFTMIKPPAMRKASILMPKKASTYCPVKNDINKMMNTFTAVQNDMRDLSALVSSWVRPTNIGTAPKGLITEKRATKM